MSCFAAAFFLASGLPACGKLLANGGIGEIKNKS
jgi:hypothetical protein